MPVNLSVKNVPDELAERLRKRAARNRRSLQQELLSILESATGASARPLGGTPGSARQPPMTVEEVAQLARELFPDGTESSVDFIRKMRDSR
jgi:plasmid stability protein